MLDIALKEWAVVCDLLLEGRLTLLLRKGGIHEAEGPGRFALEHERFLLFPSWAHQKPEMLKPEFRPRVELCHQEPAEITFRGMGEVAGIWRIKDHAAFAKLDNLHCWTPAHIDMRFAYRPQNPLYLMVVRMYRLAQPKIIKNTPAYGGCKSWVPLAPEHAVNEAGEQPVLGVEALKQILDRVHAALG